MVNAVCPGAMRTAMLLDETPPEVVRAYESRIPLGRLADPMEVAKVVVFLAEDDASYIGSYVRRQRRSRDAVVWNRNGYFIGNLMHNSLWLQGSSVYEEATVDVHNLPGEVGGVL